MPRILVWTLFILSFAVFIGGVCDAQDRHQAESGMLDLSAHNLYQDGNVKLDGNWAFFWDRVNHPEDFKGNHPPTPDGYYPVPKYWTAYKGLSLPAKGRASYRLVIKVPPIEQPLSLLTPEFFTHYQLFINGEAVGRHGKDKEGIPFLRPRIFTFHNSNDTIEILLNIENHLHGNAGIGQSIFIGSPENIRKQSLFNIITEMVLVAVCLFSGIYHILLFSFRRKEKELLYFGLFSIFIALRTATTGTTFITQLFPDLPFLVGSRLATLVIPISVMSFQAYAYYFFRPLSFKKPHQILMIMHGGYLTLSLFAPSMLYSSLFTPYLLIIAFSCLLVGGTTLYGILKKFRYAFIFWAACSLFSQG